jgi:hypothetical protein
VTEERPIYSAPIGACRQLLACTISDLQICAVIRGNIAIPSPKSLKRSRPKRKRELPSGHSGDLRERSIAG